MSHLLRLSCCVVVLSALAVTGCDDEASGKKGDLAQTSRGNSKALQAKRAEWKASWKRWGELPDCPEGVPAENLDECKDAHQKNAALRQAEEKDAPTDKHLEAAYAAAASTFEAAKLIRGVYLYKLLNRGALPGLAKKLDGGVVGADAGPKGDAGTHSGAPTAEQLKSIREAMRKPMGAEDDHAHGGKERDPLERIASAYMSQERRDLERLVTTLQEGSAKEQQHALRLLEKYAKKNADSRNLRQMLNEAILLLPKGDVRDKVTRIRKKMGSGVVRLEPPNPPKE